MFGKDVDEGIEIRHTWHLRVWSVIVPDKKRLFGFSEHTRMTFNRIWLIWHLNRIKVTQYWISRVFHTNLGNMFCFFAVLSLNRRENSGPSVTRAACRLPSVRSKLHADSVTAKLWTRRAVNERMNERS